MRGRGGRRLVAVPLTLAVVGAGLIGGGRGLQAGLEWSRATGEQHRCQIAAHRDVTQLPAWIGVVLRCQVLGIGQQLINLPIAITTTGGHLRASASRAREGALVEGADGLHGGPLAVRTQLILVRQLLCLGEAWARALAALLGARR